MRTVYRIFWLAITSLFCTAGYAQTSQAAPPAQHKAGELVIEAANMPVPGTSQEVPIEFGTLYVLENRKSASGRLIGIVFLRFKSTSAKPGPPMIYLEGGPGISGINAALGNLYSTFALLQKIGDVIVVDQRGSGRSNRLTCPAGTQDLLGASLDRVSMLKQIEAESKRCADALKAQGVDLAAYNTNENADDIDDLRKVLNAPSAYLLSYSYGTHLALTVLKRHPDNFPRAVFIGTAGLDHLQKLPSGLQQDLVQISKLAQADAKVAAKVPDLPGLMAKVLDQLEKKPVSVELFDNKTKQKAAITVDKFGLQWLTSAFISRKDFVGVIPALYYSLSQNDVSLLTALLQKLVQRPALPATQYTIRCSSGVSKERYTTIQSEAGKTLLGDAVNFPWPEICAAWGVNDLGADFRKMTRSNATTLFLSGTLDANAPSSNVEQLRQWFPNNAHLVVEGADHEDFLLDPALREKVQTIIADFMQGKAPGAENLKASPLKFMPVQ